MASGNWEKGMSLFGNVLRRIAPWPLAAKVWLVVPALIVLGLSILLSPFVAIAALFVFIIAVAVPKPRPHAGSK